MSEAKARRLVDLRAQIKVAQNVHEAARKKLWRLEEEHDRLQTEQRLEDFDRKSVLHHGDGEKG